jgi:hypothetical protein
VHVFAVAFTVEEETLPAAPPAKVILQKLVAAVPGPDRTVPFEHSMNLNAPVDELNTRIFLVVLS